MEIPERDDVIDTNNHEAVQEILIERYKFYRTITFETLAIKLAGATGLLWPEKMELMIDLLNAMNQRAVDYMPSTCVVGKDHMPPSGYFSAAQQLGLLPQDASTYEMLKFWVSMYENTASQIVDTLEEQPAE